MSNCAHVNGPLSPSGRFIDTIGILETLQDSLMFCVLCDLCESELCCYFISPF